VKILQRKDEAIRPYLLTSTIRKVKMEKDTPVITTNESQTVEEPQVIEEIVVEELSIDGVCGVY
jgi:mycofactocin precursor